MKNKLLNINNSKNKIVRIALLGSTGSIGVQTLDVIKNSPNLIINYLTTNTRIDILENQLQYFTPKAVVITDENSYKTFKQITKFKGEILFGVDGLIEVVNDSENDLVITALVGFAGVIPTIEALKKGTNVALANKETLVSAGELVYNIAKKHNAGIIAIDSEHSAILQCLIGEEFDQIEKIILTASGGPFFGKSKEEFKNIKVKDALNHPNWSMGAKITIDSATMMNKGLEVIEAKWLFDIDYKKIDVLIHQQSIIHSLVQFNDGSVKAQLGLPDMRIPISYAINYPNHYNYDFPRLDLAKIGNLTFDYPDYDKFKCLKLAFDCLATGGLAPTILNASNEIAVNAFLNEQINFEQIPICIEETLNSIENKFDNDLETIIEIDKQSRKYTSKIISKL